MQTWRLITTYAASAAYNMALDESLLEFASKKLSPPTLRFYSWQVPSLSLGYAQSITDINTDAIMDRGWQWVRRPTGGRAILHADEITYSITAPVDNFLVSGSLLESYQRISRALQLALRKLGINTNADKEYASANNTSFDPVCFKVPSNFEITYNGKKLIGSAQARKNNGVLQHGAIPISGDLRRINDVLFYSSEEQRILANNNLLEHATTLETVSGKLFAFQEIAYAITNSFTELYPMEFLEQSPTQEELQYASLLEKDKYSSNGWNMSR